MADTRRSTTPQKPAALPNPWSAQERPAYELYLDWKPYDPKNPFAPRESAMTRLVTQSPPVPPLGPYAPPDQTPLEARKPAPVGLLGATVRPQFPAGKGFPASISVSGDVNTGADAPYNFGSENPFKSSNRTADRLMARPTSVEGANPNVPGFGVMIPEAYAAATERYKRQPGPYPLSIAGGEFIKSFEQGPGGGAALRQYPSLEGGATLLAGDTSSRPGRHSRMV